MTLPERLSEKKLTFPCRTDDMRVSDSVQVSVCRFASASQIASTRVPTSCQHHDGEYQHQWVYSKPGRELPQATIITCQVPVSVARSWRPLVLAGHVFSCEAVLNKGCAQRRSCLCFLFCFLLLTVVYKMSSLVRECNL